MNDDGLHNFPEDLQDVARALLSHRAVADAQLLERVFKRVRRVGRRPPLLAGLRLRLTAVGVVLVCLGLNVSGALAAVLQACGLSSSSAGDVNLLNLLSSYGSHTSTGYGSQSAGKSVYCQEQGGGGQSDNNGGSEHQGGGSEQSGQKTWTDVGPTSYLTVNGKSEPTYTTTTTVMRSSSGSEQSGEGSESNGGGGCCPSGQGQGSESSGGSEDVQRTTTTWVNGTAVSTKTANSYEDSELGQGSEQNGCSVSSGGSSGGSGGWTLH